VRNEASDARDRAEREAEHEVAEIIDRFSQEARPHLNALKNVPRSLLSHVEELEALLHRKMQMTPFADRRRSFLKDLKKHDRVFVPRYGQVCRVEKMNRGDERLTVRVGSVSMEIGFDDISWVTPPDAES
jgi:dsDNA-specific endonuclease/ATPase MutS2